jgi:hypothetical protein
MKRKGVCCLSDLNRRNKLIDELLRADEFDCRKHGLAPDPEQYAVDRLLALSRLELLVEVGDAIDTLLDEVRRDARLVHDGIRYVPRSE